MDDAFVFQELGVYGSFANVEEFNLGLIPFDSDLLSMEMDEMYRVCCFLKISFFVFVFFLFNSFFISLLLLFMPSFYFISIFCYILEHYFSVPC